MIEVQHVTKRYGPVNAVDDISFHVEPGQILGFLRTSARVVLSIPITYHAGNTVIAALTLNLGKGGVGVRTMNPLDPGTQVRGRFRLPGAERDIEVTSRVVWSDRRVGMGLQFEQVDSGDQATIDEFVDQQGAAS